MTEPSVFIPVLLGTNRQGRESGNVAAWLNAKLRERPEIETQYFDVEDFALPGLGYGTALKDQFPEWRDAIVRCDGLIVVSPEYNHGYPGILKSVLDLLLKEYIHKAVGFVGVSAGSFGGARGIENLLPVVRELGWWRASPI